MAEEESNSLEYTPTWIVAVVCLIIVLISLAAERGLHRLGKCLLRKEQDQLFQALQKIKEELMLLGFISLLLTVFQGFISNMCVPVHLTSFMLPCKKEVTAHEKYSHRRRLLSGVDNVDHCAKGKVQFFSLEALHQLHIFIFVLAVVFVVFNATTMILAGIKVRRWKHWEESLRREISRTNNGKRESTRINQIHARHRHEFFKQHKGHSTIVGAVVSFFKQFYGSVTKSDYIALRHGFIMSHCPKNPQFDFHKYMLRTLEYDFKKVVGISWWLWLFVVLFLLLNMEGWHAYFWLSFLPLILLLLVGAKLENIISSLAEEIEEKKNKNKSQVVPGDEDEKAPWVKPSDKHFWFGRPSIILYLIHFILFQNSFEIAFLLWVLLTYGIHSCILDRVGFIIPRIIVGVIVQLLCSYSTLPLYTIVTQMGTMFKPGILKPMVHDVVKSWFTEAKERSANREDSSARKIELQNTGPKPGIVLPAVEETTVCIESFQVPQE